MRIVKLRQALIDRNPDGDPGIAAASGAYLHAFRSIEQRKPTVYVVQADVLVNIFSAVHRFKHFCKLVIIHAHAVIGTVEDQKTLVVFGLLIYG